MTAESRLNHGLVASVLGFAAVTTWGTIFGAPERIADSDQLLIVLVGLFLSVVQFGCYVWFAVSVAGAAKLLNEPAWGYVSWILVAPCFSLIPIPVIPAIIVASPLSIKFFLGAQLARAIREAITAD